MTDQQGPTKPMTPPDPQRCQAEKPNGATFMTFGDTPRLVRCSNTPIVIATEREVTHEDQRKGSMSLCPECMNKFIGQLGQDFATFEAIIHDAKEDNDDEEGQGQPTE